MKLITMNLDIIRCDQYLLQVNRTNFNNEHNPRRTYNSKAQTGRNVQIIQGRKYLQNSTHITNTIK